jgi:PAS domain S-box-containing protein
VRPSLSAHLGAILILLVALTLRGLLDPLAGSSLPFVTLFGSIAAAVWVGGYRSGIVVALLGYLAGHALFTSPLGDSVLDAPHVLGERVTYLVGAALILTLGGTMRLARDRATHTSEVLEAIVASIDDAVIVTDGDGRVTFLNRPAAALTAWSPADAVGEALERVYAVIDGMSGHKIESSAYTALRTNVIRHDRVMLAARDGERRLVADKAIPIQNRNGDVSGTVVVFRDVSERRRSERPASSEARSKSVKSGPHRRILVVVDDQDAAYAVAASLAKHGHRVATARDDVGALALAGELRPEFVLLDTSHTAMDANEVCRRLRELPAGGRMVILALDGPAQDGDRRKACEAGFDGHLVKPAHVETLAKLFAPMGPDGCNS